MPKPLKKLVRAGSRPPGESLAVWIDRFLDYVVHECHLAANTAMAYRRDTRRFATWLGARRPEALGIRDFTDYAGWLGDQKLAPASVARHLASLKVFYRYLQLEGLASDNQVELLASPKLWERMPRVLSPQVVDQLLAAPRASDPCFRRDRALLEMLYATGCRVSELAELRLADLHLEQRYARCLGKGNKQRLVPLGRKAVEAIADYLERERPRLAQGAGNSAAWLFLSYRGRRLRRQRVWELIKRYALRAGAPDDMTPHTLRHSFATHLVAGGADLRQVQELLGHANIATTQIYTHVDHSRLQAVHRKFHPRG